MTIEIGDALPDVSLRYVGSDGPAAATIGELITGKRAVLFTVPGAFTPTCSAKHLPGYIEKAQALRDAGIDLIACVSVNDAFVMGAWAKTSDAGDSVMMIADGNGDFVRATGLDVDQTERGMGLRAQRAALVVDDGVVTHLFVEPKGSFGVSSAESVLAAL